jgi:transcription-repair coupling factor (superfamily II helicase)
MLRAPKQDFYKINGLAGSSALYFVSQHAESGLILMPSDQDLLRARDTLQYFKPESKVFAYPAFEQTFDPVRQEPSILFERLATLGQLSAGFPSSGFVVTSLEAWSQKTLLPKRLRESCVVLKRGDWIERDQLSLKLFALGFKQDELAEDPGFFAIRGFLIDLFLPNTDKPLRIEFFGDEIVSIRNFDLQSQRSLQDLTEIVVTPCREIITSPDRIKKAREKIKNLADEKGFSLEDREKLFFDLEHQRDVLEPRWILPAFEDQLGALKDYLPQNLPVFWINKGTCLSAYEESQNSDALSFQDLKRICFEPSLLTQDPAPLLETPAHELETLISGRGLTYDVQSFEDLRDRLVKSKSFGPLESTINDLKEKGLKVYLNIPSAKRRTALAESLSAVTPGIEWIDGPLFDGFASSTFGVGYLSERDIFGVKRKATRTSRRSKEDFLRQFSDIADGDYVIHEDHGLARYRGLQTLDINGGKTEFLMLEFADQDKLYLPIYRLDKLSRYVSEGHASPKLDRLGSQVFLKKKTRLKEDILKIAHELLQVAAQRKVTVLQRKPISDIKAYERFCQDFPHELTPDQEAAVQEIEADLERDHAMDRLVCGDVGFGKTEVAIRAAMLTLLRGQQVALIAPTTILAEQHYRGLLRRFRSTPFKIERLSRFSSALDSKKIMKALEKGEVHLVIGTHRLLAADVKFHNLGLLICDEEQKFGVKHKERIKKMKADLDVLTLSATPIPRTLQLSVTGLRDLSLITTPPENRQAVKTYVGTFEQGLIQKAVERELARGGQVLFVHNRVQTIDALAERLKEWLPNVKMVVAHGQMKEDELEERMIQFIEGRADILIATSIIENGLDIANANTMIVDHAELFGLSNLYQLRGRVGRSHQSSSAYFLIHETTTLTPEAHKRLRVIQTCTELGSGFNVATHDLEIRGSGNLLGEQQSGVIAEVGLELYSQMLQETLAEMKSETRLEPLPELTMGYTAFIPEAYIPDPSLRISTYKQLNRVRTPGELLEMEDELLDRFGLYPRELENLCQIMRLRTYATALQATAIDLFPGRLTLTFGPQTKLESAKIIPLLKEPGIALDPKGRLSLTYSSSLKKPHPTAKAEDLAKEEQKDFEICRRFLKRLCEVAGVQSQEISSSR